MQTPVFAAHERVGDEELSHAQNALAFVEMDVKDGAARALLRPGKEFAYRPVTAATASQLAASRLQSGERLGTPVLRWDFATSHPAIAHTFAAFWEIPIERDAQTSKEVIRVVLNGGHVLDREQTP